MGYSNYTILLYQCIFIFVGMLIGYMHRSNYISISTASEGLVYYTVNIPSLVQTDRQASAHVFFARGFVLLRTTGCRVPLF